MVYCGKPSRGCQMCRTRRIKCDETKPTCLQCQKSRRQCPGYKDDFDLVFRNETQATERRAKRATTASKKSNTQVAHARQRQQSESTFQLPSSNIKRIMATSSNASSALISPTSTESDDSALTVISSSASVPNQIDTTIESQAIHFFLSNWVLLPSQGTSRGVHDFLLPLLRTASPDSHLSLTFSAVGFAALGNRSSPGINSKGLLPYAAQKYAKALKKTNEALRDPILAKQDSTLASVLLLGLFEQITSCRSNLMGWGSHVDGAAALIKMRGKKQLRTAVGKGLFIAVRNQMAVNCNSSSKPPIMGTEFWFADLRKEPYGQPSTRLNLLVAELRAEVNTTMTMAPRTATNIEKVLGLMRRAQSMEEEYVKWKSTLPPEWLPRRAVWDGHGQAEGREAEWPLFPGEVQSFEDLWQATVWTMGRVSRLFLAGIVVRCAAWICSPLDYRETPEYAEAASLATQMIAEIISTVPFHLGHGVQDFEGQKMVGMIGNGDYAVGGGGLGAQKAFPRSLGGFFILWPLFTVACSDFSSDSQRKWANGRLRWITEEMGINQAGVLSQFQLRLPSMVIKRDGMGISIPTAKDMAKHTGPTGALPPAARPSLIMQKNSNATNGGVQVKFDETSPGGSRTSSIAGGSSLMTGRNGSVSSSSSRWGTTIQQQQHPNHNQNPDLQQGPVYGQRQYVSQQHNGDESNSRYVSPQRQEPQILIYSEPSSSYSQAPNQQFQFQNQIQHPGSSSYDQITIATSPSTYSTTTVSDSTALNGPHSANSSISYDASIPNLNHYKPVEQQPRSMTERSNDFDIASKIDRFVELTSGNNSPAHSTSYSPHHSSTYSPTNVEGNHLSPPEQHYGNSMNQSSSPHYQTSYHHTFARETPNNMEFKVESPETSTYYNHTYASTNPSSNNHHEYHTNLPTTYNNPTISPTHWNPPATTQQPISTYLNRFPTNNNTIPAQNRLSLNTGMNPSEQNRLDWEIEMVAREVAKGNELERRQYQRHLRDLDV